MSKVRTAQDYSVFFRQSEDCPDELQPGGSFLPFRPGSHNSQNARAVQYQWYVPGSDNGVDGENSELSLWVGRVYDRAVVYLNGMAVWSNDPADSDDPIYQGQNWALIPLPHPEVEVTVCFSRGPFAAFAGPGFVDPLILGSGDEILLNMVRNELDDLGISSVTLALGLICLALYAFFVPFRSPPLLVTSLLLFTMSMYQWSTMSMAQLIVPSAAVRLYAFHFSSLAFSPVFSFLLACIFDLRWLRYAGAMVLAIALCFLFHAMLIGGLHPAGPASVFAGGSAAPLLLVGMIASLRWIFQGKNKGWLLLPGFLVFFLSSLLEYLGVVYSFRGDRAFSNRWSFLIFQFCLASYVLMEANQSREATEKSKEKKYESGRSVAENRYRTLQERMAPHFLFNSLNLIHSYIERGNPRAGEAIMMLASHYRYLINDMERRLVLFDQEWEFSRRYCQLVQLRFEDHLRIEMERHGDFAGILIPPLTIQPVIENAYRHGLRDYTSNGLIEVMAHIEGDMVRIQVLDNGRGVEPGALVSSIGGVERRLKDNFRHAKVTMQRRSDRGTCVEIEYSTEPVESQDEESE